MAHPTGGRPDTALRKCFARFLRGLTVLLAAMVLAGPFAHAADPQPYTVAIAETGHGALDRALSDSSMLVSLRRKAPVGPFALVARAQEDAERFVTALHSFGYYKGKVEVRIAGRALDDPALPELLDHAPAEPPVPVTVSLTTGPLFHLRKVEIQGKVPQQVRAELGLAPEAPAVASDVLAARERLLSALRDQGYALAKVAPPVAILEPAANALDVTYPVHAGPRVDLGHITVKGLKHLNESFVRRRLLVHSGERFDPAAIEKARQDLASLGVFSSVRTRAAMKLDAQGRLPIEFDVTERKRHAVSFDAAYSTDLGASFSTAWKNRNLLGNAEQLSLTGGVTQLGGNSTTGIGYNAAVTFIKPDFVHRDQSLQGDLGAIKQSLDAYDQKAVTADVLLNRKFSEHWSRSIGLAAEQETITQEGVTRDYTLLGLPLTMKYDTTNSLLDPTQGIRAAASVTPTQPLSGPRATTFLLMQLSGSAYLSLGEPGRSVLALRGVIGDAEGASQFELPPDKRFYAGGSATVRGYKYQSIGPQFPDDKPVGGSALVAGTVEFRQRILKDYGAVAFVDAGQVTADGPPFTGTWRVGAGVGARYYTKIGPIRLDVAVPLTRLPGGDAFELYIGIGQAF
jgi:translocation and assembly module TamA